MSKKKFTKPTIKKATNPKESANQSESQTKTDKVDFSQKKWVVVCLFIFSIFGALGGIPALFQFLERQEKKPKFNFVTDSFLYGIANDNMPYPKTTVINLSGTATNEGEKPILPQLFEVTLLYKGKEYDLTPTIIPKGYYANFDTARIEYSMDLQLTKLITYQDPAHGTLMYYTTSLSVDEINKMIEEKELKFKLTCQDVYNKKMSVTLPVPIDKVNPKDIFSPRNGVRGKAL